VLTWLILMLVVLAATLIVLLWGGSYFFQGYIYTEPSPGIYWQGPLAGIVMATGFTVWCLTIAYSSGASQKNVPIDTIFRFTPHEDMQELAGRPVAKIVAIRASRKKGGDKDGEKIVYSTKRDERGRYVYMEVAKARPWQPQDVIALEMELPDKNTLRFDLQGAEPGGYREFVSSDGWTMREFEDGPTGMPTKFRVGRLLWNLFFNAAHLLGWFLVLWLVLRFHASHAMGFGVVLWIMFTVIFLPMMLTYAGFVAANRQSMSAQ